MKREWLKEKCPNLTEAEIDTIMAENGSDINKAKGDAKKLEDDIKTLKSEKKTIQGQLDTANETIEDLKKSNEETIKKLNDDHKAEVTKMARDAINTELLNKYKAKNNKVVMALIDELEAKTNDDYKTLLDSKLKSLSEAEDTKFMFGEAQIKQIYNPVSGEGPDKVGIGASMATQRNTTQAPSYDPWGNQ